jgi:hypothetical protein
MIRRKTCCGQRKATQLNLAFWSGFFSAFDEAGIAEQAYYRWRKEYGYSAMAKIHAG